jgi:succinate-semialdehyde dehydrogenase/glutarate-semialdehyde dehydrogenase
MQYQSLNPYTGIVTCDMPFDPLPDLTAQVEAYDTWRKLTIEQRGIQLKKLASVIEQNKEQYASLITEEMGKPYRESLYEINKVLTAFDYYIEAAPTLLRREIVSTAASESYVSFEPLGIILSVMPWNFPFWQVFRFAVPALIAGNVTLLKHAPSVPRCAQAIAAAFDQAGMTAGIFSQYFLSNDDTARLIADARIAGVSFTGSDATGAVIAGLAGQHIKKSVIELGGNDAFIVLDDADIDLAVAGAIKSRSINSGQSCNAAKRFIVTDAVYDTFVSKLAAQVQTLAIGDPMAEATQIGPLARRDLAMKVRQQIADTIAQGARAYRHLFVASDDSNFVSPIVLTGVKPGMTAFDQEIFGPVWSVIRAGSVHEAVTLANQSQYGLGASIWTADMTIAKTMISELDTGNVFINEIVKSDARLPFGGIKRSGFGRELSAFGLREFVNIKTVFIH